jgi:drug/metabolite transporter (DMT)-like permease
MSATGARLQVLMVALLFSTGGAAIKAEAFSALQVSAVRSAIAALVLLIWLRSRALAWSWPVLGAAAVYACVLTTFVVATKLTTAANAIFLQSTAPLYLLLLGPWLLRERVRRRDLVYMAAVAAGIVACFIGQQSAQATAPDPVLGNLTALASSVFWALTLLMLRVVARSGAPPHAAMSAVVLGNVLAALVAMPFAWPLPAATAGEWATLVYLGVFQIGLAYALLTTAMRRLPALEVSLLLLIEPVLNPLWTWLFRGEQAGTWVIAGGALIVVATAAKSVYDARQAV